MKFIFSIIGAYIGALIDSLSGFFFGAAIGFLFAYVFELKKQLRTIEEKLSLIQTNLIDSNVMADQTTSEGIEVDNVDIEEIALTDELVDSEEVTEINARSNELPVYSSMSVDQTEGEEAISDKRESSDSLIDLFKRFFTSGNVVVKVGIIILFFGIAFLLKYAAQRDAFPIELRLIAVAAGAVAMLFVGWRLRLSKQKYALVLQGGALGILYLTLFAAAQHYQVLPLSLTFFVMVGLVVFSCFLAVLQDSRSLASLATMGGFLAPVLTSSGEGNHIALFSYYAALNAGIFAIAWFKVWRILNWLGFVFTFVIASLWGHESYQAMHFNTTEPFLILFFLFYVAISILFAFKQPPHLKGLVDGSLVFGVPLVGFTLQVLLVKNYEFGQAYSALAMGVFYILLARCLWNKQVEGMRLLSESFLSLGVIFSSLAIPFALDGNWTAAVWAVEGAAISWVGIRQRRLPARIFGILLQFGGSLFFLQSNATQYDDIPILNSTYMGSFLLSMAALFSAYIFYKRKIILRRFEQPVHWLMLSWGLLWWFCAGLIEIDEFVSSPYELNISLLFVTLSLLVLSLVARTIKWKAAEYPPVLLLPAMYLACFIHLIDAPSTNLLRHYGVLSWVLAFSIQMLILYRCEWIWNKKILSLWHAFTMYLYVFVCCLVIADFVAYLNFDANVWEFIVWGAIPAFGILKMMYLRDRLSWPVMDYPQSYVSNGLLPIVIYLGIWVIIACYSVGDPSPLSYIPVLNPLELVQALSLIIMLNWLLLIKKEEIRLPAMMNLSFAFAFIGAITFIWITSIVAHSVHFYAGVRFDESAMLASEVFQTSISIVWTLTAFMLMWISTQNRYRKIWFIGAGLLGVVVIKLFLIDLIDSNTVTRIISFMTVGLLMLIIGYFSPIPPKKHIED